MKRIFRNTAAALMLSTAIIPAAAQELRTSYFMQTSNFRHQMNPALLDAPYFTMLLGNFNIGTTGNVGLSNFVYKLDGNPRYDLTTFMNPTVSAGDFLGSINDKNRADIYVNYNVFSLGFRAFKGINLLEVNVRSNTNLSLPYELFEFMKTTGAKDHYQLNDIGLRTQNYVEVALGHSHRITDRLTIGAKLKFLLGAAYADFQAEKLDITMNGDYWRIQGDARLKASILESQLEYETADKNAPDGRKRVKSIEDVTFGLPGFGMAVDLGATYKLMDDLTLSASLTDLGYIKWGKTKQASSTGDYTFEGFENIYTGSNDTGNNRLGDQFDALSDDLEEMFAIYDDGETSHKQSLAATLNIGAEYTFPFYRKLRFGALYTSRFNGLYSYHQALLSATVRPVKWIEASVNTALTSTGTTFGAALSLKAKHFNFYVGADRILGKVSKEFIPLNNLNANVNVGMTFPL